VLGIVRPGAVLPPPPGALVVVSPDSQPQMALVLIPPTPEEVPPYDAPIRAPKPYRN
jgi:hypothetical protein